MNAIRVDQEGGTGQIFEIHEDLKERFIFDGKKAVMVETDHPEIKSLAEMRDNTHSGRWTGSLAFDLTGTGKKDVIKGEDAILATVMRGEGYILWSVQFVDGTEFSSDIGCLRVGVLATKTNGLNDIVCSRDIVFHWTGSEYKPDLNSTREKPF